MSYEIKIRGLNQEDTQTMRERLTSEDGLCEGIDFVVIEEK